MNDKDTTQVNSAITAMRHLQSWSQTGVPQLNPDVVIQFVLATLEDLAAPPLATSYRLEDLTGAIVRRLWLRDGVTSVPIRQCGICSCWLTYEFDGSMLNRDTSCDCNSLNNRSIASFDDILQSIRMQSTRETQLKVAQQYKLPVV
jgi:hypothetical protein